jgi:glycerate kinase
LRTFAGARLEPGFALFARFARLEERLRQAQLVLTGEGALDASTLMGKGVGAIAQLCKSAGLPCIGLAGVVTDAARAAATFTETHALTPEFTSAAESMREPAVWLELLAAKAGAEWRPAPQ